MVEIGYNTLTPEQQAEANAAIYVVRELGKPAIRGYSDDLKEAYGLAHRTMLSEGSQIDVPALPSQRIELRISEDRSMVTVRWVPVEAQEPISISADT